MATQRQEQVAQRIIAVHGDRLKINPNRITTLRDKIAVTCVEHGQSFWQDPNSLITGSFGCPICKSNLQRQRRLENIAKQKNLH